MKKQNEKGSITVEASLIMPVFLSVILFFLYFFQIMLIQERVSIGLWETAKEISKYGYIYDAYGMEEMESDYYMSMTRKLLGGFLTEEKMLDKKRTKEMIELIHEYGREAVFHRAFDCTDNQDSAAEKLIRLGADRILTSGGAVNVWDGRKQLKHLQNQYGKDITILAGSGVNDTNVRALIEYTGITQVHSSCGSWKCDVTAAGNAVDFSYDEAMKNCYQCADAGKVRKLTEEVSGV